MKLDANKIGRQVMREITLEVDMSRVLTSALGIYKWRLVLAMQLIRLASIVLRTDLDVSIDSEAD